MGLKPKSLCLTPQKFAIACQEHGWIIRSEIIWAKPNPMPESVKDRPTRSHEQVWMMTKQGKYYWDQDAVKEVSAEPNRTNYQCGKKLDASRNDQDLHERSKTMMFNNRNIRSVWTIATSPTPEAHFATWPEKLARRMIRAATKPGDIVFDPFCGTGKTVIEAERQNRVGIGMDLSWEYLSDIALKRLAIPLQRELVPDNAPDSQPKQLNLLAPDNPPDLARRGTGGGGGEMKPNINDRESLMQAWDSWVRYFKTNEWGSWPRDAFESIIDAFYERHDAVLSAARAVVDVYSDIDISERGPYVCVAKDEWFEHFGPALKNLADTLRNVTVNRGY